MARQIGVLYNLQVLHLVMYLIASPVTFLAERQILYFDFLHCFAVSYTLILPAVALRPGDTLGWLSYFRPRNAFLATAMLVFAVSYITHRYIGMFSADSRAPREAGHYDRFIPYRTAP